MLYVICYNTQRVRYIFEIFRRAIEQRRLHIYRPILISVLRHAMAIQPSSSLYIPAEYPVQFLFITLTTIPSILRNVVLSNFQFIPDNIRVVSLWYSKEVCNSPTVSNARFPPKCGSRCNIINDIGKSRYQQYSWTTGFRFDSRFSRFLCFFLILLRQDKRNQCFDPNSSTNFAIYKESSKDFL